MILLLALGFPLLAACGSGGGEDATDAARPDAAKPDAGAPGAVTMRLIAFRPGVVEVAAGTPVTWTQEDAGFHTVTSGSVEQGSGDVTPQPDGQFDSGEIPKGETFSVTLDRPGTYPYFCNIHPATMRGEIKVTETK